MEEFNRFWVPSLNVRGHTSQLNITVVGQKVCLHFDFELDDGFWPNLMYFITVIWVLIALVPGLCILFSIKC